MAEIKNAFTEFLVRLKADKKAMITVILGLTGILLIALSELPSVSSRNNTDNIKKDDYSESDLCRDVEKLISQDKGAGDVSVMLTYETKGERIFAKDSENEHSDNNKIRTSDKYIILDSGQGEDGLIIKEVYPEIRGVAVVCTGGADPQVRREISDLLSALFDIRSNRISIAAKGETE